MGENCQRLFVFPKDDTTTIETLSKVPIPILTLIFNLTILFFLTILILLQAAFGFLMSYGLHPGGGHLVYKTLVPRRTRDEKSCQRNNYAAGRKNETNDQEFGSR